MTAVTSTGAPAEARPGRLSLRRLPLALLVAAVAAVAVNLVIRAVTVAAVDTSSDYRPMQIGAIVFMTVLSAVAAAVVLGALILWARRRAERVFWIVSTIAVVLSLAPVILLEATEQTDPALIDGTPTHTAVLGILHLVTYAIVVWTLLRLSRRGE